MALSEPRREHAQRSADDVIGHRYAFHHDGERAVQLGLITHSPLEIFDETG
jgi:hypothetical protein